MQKKTKLKKNQCTRNEKKQKNTNNVKQVYLDLKPKPRTSSNHKTIENAVSGHKLQQQKTSIKIGQILIVKK